MINLKNYVLQQFEINATKEGLFWRIIRPDTFVDLLMLQAGKASKSGIDDKLAVEVVLIAIKALVNEKFGIKDYTTDYKQLNKELLDEQYMVQTEVERIISECLLNLDTKTCSLPLSDDLNYFKVLNNLEIVDYSPDIFKNIITVFLGYLKSAK